MTLRTSTTAANTTEDVQEFVRSHIRIQPFGGRTKPALSTPTENSTALDMSRLSGIVEYEPDEYTMTAKAGSAIQFLADALAEHDQYMPFDPLLVKSGATLGGTVAANTSGSGRFRYGGTRDFMLGIRFVDGHGRVVRGGGKVVKNASGFDLPKFMTGSLGRYGVLTEITIKVFPKPATYGTLELTFTNLDDALNATFALSNQPFEIDALDFRPVANGETPLWIRIGGLGTSLSDRMNRLSEWLRSNTQPETITSLDDDKQHWAGINQLTWASPDAPLIKIPLAPKQVPTLNTLASFACIHFSAAGNVAWATATDLAAADNQLREVGLGGQLIWGAVGRPYIGYRPWISMARRVKRALDPNNRFLEID